MYNFINMKKIVIFLLTLCAIFLNNWTYSQCSICTKTAGQMGNGPAQGMNVAIIYLALAPFAIIIFVYFKWKTNKIK